MFFAVLLHKVLGQEKDYLVRLGKGHQRSKSTTQVIKEMLKDILRGGRAHRTIFLGRLHSTNRQDILKKEVVYWAGEMKRDQRPLLTCLYKH